jgi:putative ABC transport system substrate-binding protein
MKRREFMAFAYGMAISLPCHVLAQRASRVYRLALFHPSSPPLESRMRYAVLLQRLEQLGYVEGRNLKVDVFSGEGHPERYAEHAKYIVSLAPDAIFTSSAYTLQHFKSATSTIPVIGITADPVAFGIVPTLAHPGGNVTGVIVDAGLELWGKRLALLKEAVPKLSRASFLTARAAWEAPPGAAVREAAQKIGISLIGSVIDGALQEAEYRHIFPAITAQGVDAVIVSDQAEHITNRKVIIELVEKAHLPAIYPYRIFAEAGGFMVYTVDLADLLRHAAEEIDEIF